MTDDRAATLVTGGTGVVGLAVARRLLQEGGRVCVTYYSNTSALAALRSAELKSGQLLVIRMDLARHELISEVLDQIEQEGAVITAFVHAAALIDHTSMSELSAARFSEVLAINVTSSYLLVRELVARSQLRAVVLLSSIGAEFAGMGSIDYRHMMGVNHKASKGAVDALTRALAAELAPAVRVNAVAPGIVRSHRTDADPMFSSEEFAKRVPEGKLVEADRVAEAVAFLLDERSRFITGQVLRVDGGISLRLLGGK
jgi:NAD(P)-dependent dehydrogenase (short-subunit alcohol dehydrogenase family)